MQSRSSRSRNHALPHEPGLWLSTTSHFWKNVSWLTEWCDPERPDRRGSVSISAFWACNRLSSPRLSGFHSTPCAIFLNQVMNGLWSGLGDMPWCTTQYPHPCTELVRESGDCQRSGHNCFAPRFGFDLTMALRLAITPGTMLPNRKRSLFAEVKAAIATEAALGLRQATPQGRTIPFTHDTVSIQNQRQCFRVQGLVKVDFRRC